MVLRFQPKQDRLWGFTGLLLSVYTGPASGSGLVGLFLSVYPASQSDFAGLTSRSKGAFSNVMTEETLLKLTRNVLDLGFSWLRENSKKPKSTFFFLASMLKNGRFCFRSNAWIKSPAEQVPVHLCTTYRPVHHKDLFMFCLNNCFDNRTAHTRGIC